MESNFFSNNRVRKTALHGTVAMLFLAAWVSDRWPELTGATLSISFAVVAVEIGAVYALAKNSALRISRSRNLGASVAEEIDARTASVSVIAVSEGDPSQSDNLTPTHLDHQVAMAFTRASEEFLEREIRHARARLGKISAKQDVLCLAILPSERWIGIQSFVDRSMNQVAAQHSNWSTWQMTEHTDRVFDLDAGAFQIQHFHGRTNIVVRDTVNVTVQAVSGSETSCLPGEKDRSVLEPVLH